MRNKKPKTDCQGDVWGWTAPPPTPTYEYKLATCTGCRATVKVLQAAPPRCPKCIEVGDYVRSFDFPYQRDIDGPRACYVEGAVSAIVKAGESFVCPLSGTATSGFNSDRYVICATLAVFGGQARPGEGRYYFPPVNGTPTLFGNLTNHVERI